MNNLNFSIFSSDSISEKYRLRDDLEALWRDTFSDSNAYIKLVYDTYINSSIICVCQTPDGKMISSMLAIPYLFTNLLASEENFDLTGWYLCGLATIPELRGRGIMDHMMKMTEKEISLREGQFAFLVPADNRLELYYHRKGYINGAPRTRIKLNRTTRNSPEMNHSKLTVDDSGSEEDIILPNLTGTIAYVSNEIIDFLIEDEKRLALRAQSNSLRILHSRDDWESIINENKISGGRIMVAPQKAKNDQQGSSRSSRPAITAVSIGFVNNGTYEIRHLAGSSEFADRLLWQLLEEADVELLIDSTDTHRIEDIRVHFIERISEIRREQYIMVKPTQKNDSASKKCGNSPKIEIPIFSANVSSDAEYSIFTKHEIDTELCHFVSIDKISADLLLD